MLNFLKRKKKTGIDFSKYLELLNRLRDKAVDYDYWNKVYGLDKGEAYNSLPYMGYSLEAQKLWKGCNCNIEACTMKNEDCRKEPSNHDRI